MKGRLSSRSPRHRALRPFSTLFLHRARFRLFSRRPSKRRDGDIDSRRTDDCVAVIRQHLIRRRSEHLGSRQCASSAKILMFLNILSRDDDDARADISELSLRVESRIRNISRHRRYFTIKLTRCRAYPNRSENSVSKRLIMHIEKY